MIPSFSATSLRGNLPRLTVAVVLAFMLAACSGFGATSTVQREIREQEAMLPDLREEARVGIGKAEQTIEQGQIMLEEGRRLIREGEAMVVDGNDLIGNARVMIDSGMSMDARATEMLTTGVQKVRDGNALIGKGNSMTRAAEETIRRGRRELDSSLKLLLRSQQR